jgi:hypothetical protein
MRTPKLKRKGIKRCWGREEGRGNKYRRCVGHEGTREERVRRYVRGEVGGIVEVGVTEWGTKRYK